MASRASPPTGVAELGEVGAVERLTIHVYPGGRAGLSVIAHSPRGGFVTAMAERIVRDTVAANTPQLAEYDVAHLALVNVMLLDPEDLAEAFERLSDEVPANWARVWVVAHQDGDCKALSIWSR